jgi:glycosyltransferase involved in cell wall biosynthesis
MRVLFASLYPHLHDVIGGLQTTTDDLCTALVSMGAQAAVLCGQSEHSTTEHTPPQCDTALGYPVFRVADPVHDLPLLAASWEPDIIIVQSGTTLLPLLICALDTGRPTAVYLHNVETHQLGGTLVPDPSILYLANSEFTARRWRALCGLDCTVVPPLVLPERYFVPERGDSVLFVNPTQIKGVEIMFALADACPDIPFLVAESWGLNPLWRSHCLQRAAQLPNIAWHPPTHDMRTLYARARTLLMPSLWEESYGRTVVEAQINGIPVVASHRGALPEVVGAGGLLVDAHAPVDDWEQALRQAYQPSPLYDRLSEQARRQAYHTAAAPLMLSRFVAAIAAHAAGSC